MKRLVGTIIILVSSLSLFAQTKAETLWNKTFDLISVQLDNMSKDVTIEPVESPAVSEPVKYVTKERVIKDMAGMWFKLFEEDHCITLMPDELDNYKFDYSGDKVYIVFSDDMFDQPKYYDTVAFYITLKEHKPTKGEGICPVIFLRESVLDLDEFTYNYYMKPVLAHELLHYAFAVYDDFECERGHDEMFEACCKDWSNTLGFEIKIKATQYECSLLIK